MDDPEAPVGGSVMGGFRRRIGDGGEEVCSRRTTRGRRPWQTTSAGNRVWATRDSGDWIGDIPHLEVGGLGHGATRSPRTSAPGCCPRTGRMDTHGYFEPGTTSLDNFARVGNRWPIQSVSCGDGDDCTAGLR
ncbi:hypothetical protein SANTM175S_09270 [Streptomyces antimycoticus]